MSLFCKHNWKLTIMMVAALSLTAVAPALSTPEQNDFKALVTKYRQIYNQGKNELQKSATRLKRKQEFLNVMGDGQVKGWVGSIKRLETMPDGKAIIAIDIGSKIALANGIRLFGANTLINMESPLYSQLMNLSVGDKVIFSGALILTSEMDYVEEDSWTEESSMTEPEFMMRFESVRPFQSSAQSSPLTIGTLPEETPKKKAVSPRTESAWGITVQDLTPELAQKFGVDENTAGVVITELTAGSPAAEVRLSSGDIIKEVNRHEIKNVGDWHRAITEKERGVPLLLLVRRGANTFYAAIRVMPTEHANNLSQSGTSEKNRTQTAGMPQASQPPSVPTHEPSAALPPTPKPQPSEIPNDTRTVQLVYSGPMADFFIAGGDIEKNMELFSSSGYFNVELHSVYKGPARMGMIDSVKKMLGTGEMAASQQSGNPDLLGHVITSSSFDVRKKTVTFSGEQSYLDTNNAVIGTRKVQETFDIGSQKYRTLGKVAGAIESLLQSPRAALNNPYPQRRGEPRTKPTAAEVIRELRSRDPSK